MNSCRIRLSASTLALVLGLACTAIFAQEPPPSPPKNPEAPFDVFVFTNAPGDESDKNSLVRTTEEVAKKLGDRKKWFRVVEERDEADIVVEVLNQASSESVSGNYTRRTDNADPSDRQMANFLDVDKGFTLQTRVYVPRGEPIDMDVSAGGRRPRDTAKPFALRLESFCRMNYWTLKKALEP